MKPPKTQNITHVRVSLTHMLCNHDTALTEVVSSSYYDSSELQESKPSVELRLFVFDEPYV